MRYEQNKNSNVSCCFFINTLYIEIWPEIFQKLGRPYLIFQQSKQKLVTAQSLLVFLFILFPILLHGLAVFNLFSIFPDFFWNPWVLWH